VKKRVLLAAITLALVFPVTTYASSSLDHNFEQGNEFYKKGDYVAAIEQYENVVAAGYESAELYYNLGNAYFREGQLGLAILNYIRASELDPGDDDIRANLEFARQFAIDKIEVTEETIILDYINSFFNSFTLNGITWVAAILYFLTAAIVVVRFIYGRYRIPTPVFVTVLVFFLGAVVFTGVKLDRDVFTRKGVVLVQQADVKNGPGEDFNTKFTAHAGLVFEIEQEEAGYFWVNFENRLKGWIPKSVAAEI
jgi:tetratricopeptide (TPR) repeat protein